MYVVSTTICRSSRRKLVLLANQRDDIDIQRRHMDTSVLLVKAIGGGWDITQLPKL